MRINAEDFLHHNQAGSRLARWPSDPCAQLLAVGGA
jgi:hypothetical protein